MGELFQYLTDRLADVLECERAAEQGDEADEA
jgi:hypothetical protein